MLVEEEALSLAPLGAPAPPLLDRMKPRPTPQHQLAADAHAAAVQAATAQAAAAAGTGAPPAAPPLPRQVRARPSAIPRAVAELERCATKRSGFRLSQCIGRVAHASYPRPMLQHYCP